MSRTSTHARLRKIFGRILAVTSGLGVAAACGGATEGDARSNDPSAPRSLCGAGRLPTFPAGLTASPLQDFVASRFESAFLQAGSDAGDQPDGFNARTSNSTGTPCATSSDRQACLAKLDALRVLPLTKEACEAKYPNVTQPGGIHPGCQVSYVVFTRGDEVGAATNPAEIRALMGRVDSLPEAAWLLETAFEPTCGGDSSQDFTVRENDEGFEFVFANNCERSSIVRSVFVGRDGTVNERQATKAAPGTKFSCALAGRRPEGFEHTSTRGSYFASMAELEEAAVHAFRKLQRELGRLGAPRELLARVREATRDEIRHTRATRALARRDGAEPLTPFIACARSTARGPLSVAVENAREGCVRETYGALLAWHQAAHAADARVRATMRSIADDETAHAALSIDIAEWLDGLLSEDERRQVAHAREAALLELRDELDAPLDPSLERNAGLPGRERALVMLALLSAA